ncbi:hypothetical protein L3V83_15320 [Thiotrichales bacterium 19X7-9]|nr:hypothetical protein [Thiotrichales bacterium 19X7-9]
MPQFRLTQKLSKRLKIDDLSEPKVIDEPFYDDWIADIFKIQRKDVIVFMHVKTRIGLSMPLYEIGGAKNILDCFPALLEWHINELLITNYEDFGSRIRNFFESTNLNKIYFCKTSDRSVLTHLNQFKDILEYESLKNNVISQRVCDEVTEYWHTNLITNPYNKKEYTKPVDLWVKMLPSCEVINN